MKHTIARQWIRSLTQGVAALFRRPWTPILLAMAPFLYLVAVVARYRLDFPFLDQWEFIPLLEKSYEGTVTLGDLWSQHNEHRLIFPRLVMLVLAHASGWNVAWELITNIALAAAAFTLLACQLKRTERALNAPGIRWLVPLVSLLVFSLSQWENWFLGWQLQEWLNLCAVVATVMLLTGDRLGWSRLIGAQIIGIVATYSFANGLFCWPIGLVVLFAVRPEPMRPLLGAWVAVGTVTAVSYLYGYHAPEYHPSVWLVLKHPIEFSLYVLKYLGGALINFNGPGAAFVGACGLTALCALTWRALRVQRVSLRTIAPYWGFALYAIASAIITGIGRVGFGSDQAMAPRYITFANLLWVAVLALAYMVLDTPASRWNPWRRIVGGALGVALALLLAVGSAYGTYRWTERYHYRIEARDELLTGDDLEMLRRIHPEPQKIIDRRPVLRKRHLSIFK